MQIWLRFIEQFNAKSFLLIESWENSKTMKLNSDASITDMMELLTNALSIGTGFRAGHYIVL